MQKKTIILLLVLSLVSLGGIVLYEKSLMKKYKETEMKITVAELKDSWGNPDHDFIARKTERILIYKTFSGFTEYYFKFDVNNGLLIDKNFED